MTPNSPRAWVSLIDGESGLYNRLYLVHFLSEAFARARRYGGALSCVLFRASWWCQDLQDARPGGTVPAAAVKELGKLLLLGVREGDILGRWSPDEFLLVAPNTPCEGARVCMGKILEKLKTVPFEKAFGLSVSVHAAASGIPEDEGRVRYPEDLPLLAHERLRGNAG